MVSRDVEKVVTVDLDEAIERNIDEWNDYLCELTGEPTLQDITWRVVGSQDGGVLVRVSGFVEDEEEEE